MSFEETTRHLSSLMDHLEYFERQIERDPTSPNMLCERDALRWALSIFKLARPDEYKAAFDIAELRAARKRQKRKARR